MEWDNPKVWQLRFCLDKSPNQKTWLSSSGIQSVGMIGILLHLVYIYFIVLNILHILYLLQAHRVGIKHMLFKYAFDNEVTTTLKVV